jgi:tRNA-uridine 2-sulfurtransferase
MKKKKIKAVALFSGGLDSILAIKVLVEQGVEVIAVHFALPFCAPDRSGAGIAKDIAGRLDIDLRVESMGEDYLEIVKHPQHGHGTGMNPCIDCKIFMLKRAKKIADEEGAAVVVTGEVLNQRPMSQHRIALNTIEKASGLKGRLLRPLSAKFLLETLAEKDGTIDRNKLLSINGRSRREQLYLAKEMGIETFIPAAGGCILTEKFFTKKMKDILQYNENAGLDDIMILTVGRHFRFGENKIIVGRNEKENAALHKMKKPGDYIFELPEEIPGPAVVLQGQKRMEAIELAAALTLRYSDLKQDTATVLYGENNLDKHILADVSVIDSADFYNVSSDSKD